MTLLFIYLALIALNTVHGHFFIAHHCRPSFLGDLQVGIVSYGPPLACGGSNPISVFTRVSSFNAQSTSVMSTADTPNESTVDNFIGGYLSLSGVRAPGSGAGRR